MKKICIFPKVSNDSKWSQFTIDVHDETAPLMQKIIEQTSGLIRLDDLQTIEKVIHRHLKESKKIHGIFKDEASYIAWIESADEAELFAKSYPNQRVDKFVKL